MYLAPRFYATMFFWVLVEGIVLAELGKEELLPNITGHISN